MGHAHEMSKESVMPEAKNKIITYIKQRDKTDNRVFKKLDSEGIDEDVLFKRIYKDKYLNETLRIGFLSKLVLTLQS